MVIQIEGWGLTYTLTYMRGKRKVSQAAHELWKLSLISSEFLRGYDLHCWSKSVILSC